MVRENRCRDAHSAAVGGSAAYGCGVPLAGTARLSFPSAAGVDRAGAQCAPLRTVYRNITGKHGGICGTGPAIRPPSSGGKSGEGGRAATAVYHKAKDGGTLSRYLLLCESHRRRVRSHAVKLSTSLPKQPFAGMPTRKRKGKGCVKENRRFYLHVQSPAAATDFGRGRNLLGPGTKSPDPVARGRNPRPPPRAGAARKKRLYTAPQYKKSTTPGRRGKGLCTAPQYQKNVPRPSAQKLTLDLQQKIW